MGRVVFIDYGLARVGVALSDEGKKIAIHALLVEAKSPKEAINKLLAQLGAYAVEKILVGMPLRLNGSKSSFTLETEKFIALLKEATSIPVEPWDERLTTRQAEVALEGRSRKERSKIVDQVAATLALQSFLDLQPV